MNPCVSVIVPVYNTDDAYLERCLSSIAGQSFADFEVVVVDDGSTDKSGARCGEWAKKDARFRVLHTENRGPAAACNLGVASSTGEYIAFVDSDDYVHEKFLETLLSAATELDCAVSMCNYAVVFGSECPKPSFSTPTKTNSDELLSALYSKGEILLTVRWNKLYRRSLFEGESYPTGRIYEDSFVTHRLLHKAKDVAFADSALYYYRMSENSIMRSGFSEKSFDCFEMLDARLRDFSSWGMDELKWLTERRYCFKILDYLSDFELSVSDRKRLEKMYSEHESQLFSNPRSTLKTKLQFKVFRAFSVLYKFVRKRRHMG